MKAKIKIAAWLVGLLLFADFFAAQNVQAFTDSLGPKGFLDVNFSLGGPDTVFVFDASKSVDAKGSKTDLRYRFNFDYGAEDFDSWSVNPIARHTYAAPGVKTVFLEVRDSAGRIDRVTTQIEVQKSASLRGQFAVDKIAGDTRSEFNFYATMFTAGGESATNRYQFRWDFNGDGVFETLFQNTPVATHVYAQAGTFTPTLQIRDQGGNILTLAGYHTENREVGRIAVDASREPQAALSVFPKSGRSGLTIFAFDASLSNDEKGRGDFQVRFDFENDGNFDTDFSSTTKVTHIYSSGGAKTALAQIKSSSGGTDTAMVSITVFEQNSPPRADLYITNDSRTGDYLAGIIGTEFTFSAAGSRDAEDASADLEVRFDFEGDGTFDTVFSREKTARHRYFSIGEKKVTVEVKDSQGARHAVTRSINIVSNEAPRAELKISPPSGSPATKFNFDLGDARDSQDRQFQLQTRIDYDGDGSFETDFASRLFYSHAYDKAGEFKPRVEIRDRFGKIATVVGRVTVFTSSPPIAAFSHSPALGTFNTIFTFDAAASFDPETPTRDLRFRWDFDYTGSNDIVFDTPFLSLPRTTYNFSGAAGERRIRLEVEDAEGNRAGVVKSVNLHWASPHLQTLARRGLLTAKNNGDFQADRPITRAELAKIVALGAKLNKDIVYGGLFPDVRATDWHWREIEAAAREGVLRTGGNFFPDSPVNRAEALKIILLGFKQNLLHNCGGEFADVANDDWFARYVCTGWRLNLVKGYTDGKFHPERHLSIGEAAKLVSPLLP